jgi:DNA-binding CsgD family transcriptional regulator
MRSNQEIVQSLTEREREIPLCLLDRRSNRWIAESLGINVKMVEAHLITLYKKLKVKSRSQAILWWVRRIEGHSLLTRKQLERK